MDGTQDLVCASKRSTMSYILVPQLACKKDIYISLFEILSLFCWNTDIFLILSRYSLYWSSVFMAFRKDGEGNLFFHVDYFTAEYQSMTSIFSI